MQTEKNALSRRFISIVIIIIVETEKSSYTHCTDDNGPKNKIIKDNINNRRKLTEFF